MTDSLKDFLFDFVWVCQNFFALVIKHWKINRLRYCTTLPDVTGLMKIYFA